MLILSIQILSLFIKINFFVSIKFSVYNETCMRILLADDEKELVRALAAILKHENYAVDTVNDGEMAYDYLCCDDIYDLVILDVMMPKMDGFTVLKKLRANGNKVPVLLLTAKNDIDDKVFGLDNGADDYLTKPFNTKELLARVRALTRRKENIVDNNFLNFNDLKLNLKTFELSCGSKKILLTAKEYQIMELFMRKPSQYFSSDALLSKIWGYDSDTDETIVWTYISYLRKKCKALDSSSTIKAIRNLGYKLVSENDQEA